MYRKHKEMHKEILGVETEKQNNGVGSHMAKHYTIHIIVDANEVAIIVERNGRLYDEVEFHVEEIREINYYITKLLTREILSEKEKQKEK